MATAQECEAALNTLAERTAASDRMQSRRGFNRSLTCDLRDLDAVYGGAFKDGALVDIRRVDSPAADIRFELASDDLIALVDGRLRVATAWATGRIKVHAGVRDLMRLRSLF